MFDELTEEELILLTIEYVNKGIDLPVGIVQRLDSDTITLIKETTNVEQGKVDLE